MLLAAEGTLLRTARLTKHLLLGHRLSRRCDVAFQWRGAQPLETLPEQQVLQTLHRLGKHAAEVSWLLGGAHTI